MSAGVRGRAEKPRKVDFSLLKKKKGFFVLFADFLSAFRSCVLHQGMYKVIQNSIKATKTNSLKLIRTQLNINNH